MDNYLLYYQYMFKYNLIKLLPQSTINDQVEKLKIRDYMENNIPKYVIFQSLCKSCEVLLKMRQYYKEEVGPPFKIEDPYQNIRRE